jgi:hypothetical protein
MENLAARLHAQTGVLIDILPADLTNYNDLARVEARLREDSNLLPRSPSPSAYRMSHSTVERGSLEQRRRSDGLRSGIDREVRDEAPR